ncbi:MAG: PBP1A family penicillin-binding protein, partial [Actinobacteria bacterium]
AVAAAVLLDATSDLPQLTRRSLPAPSQTTKLYDSRGHLLASLYAEQNRVMLPLAKIPLHVQQAVVDAEDRRFWTHEGVDTKAIVRAVQVNLSTGELLEGGSTITQQYVRNSIISPERTLRRKVRETVLAYQLEKVLTKEEILERYLNTVYFGQSAYGVEAAAVTYFGKHISGLSLADSALLAGIIKSPNRLSPHVDADAARRARDRVLGQMYRQGHLSKKDYEVAVRSQVRVVPRRPPKSAAPYFSDHVTRLLIQRYGAAVVFKGGLRVRTSMDLSVQRKAEKAWRSVLGRKSDPGVSIVAIDPRNGLIRAMVGGRDFGSSKYNLATQAHRQPGSAFKPFVLAAALEQGVSPSKTYASGPALIRLAGGGTWNVDNATEESGGPPMTLRAATIDSVNGVFARLVMDVGPEKVAAVASDLGISTPLTPNPAIALGGLRRGVTPLEMASAYGSFANNGQWVEPTAIVEVRDSAGKVLDRAAPARATAVRPGTAALVTDILQSVIEEGTGREARIGRPAAGKTGTTQQYRDAWFVGYAPTLSAAVWVGFPGRESPMTNVRGIAVKGGTFPARIWAAFMRSALSETAATEFGPETGKTVKATVCTESSLLATAYCPSRRVAEFVSGAQPAKRCDIHGPPSASKPLVPNVVGLGEEKAVDKLRLEGFVVTVRYAESDRVGLVLSQSPRAGTGVARGATVTLTVGRAASAPTSGAPVARFCFRPASPKAGETVEFDASASWDPDGDIASYRWYFGDGAFGDGEVVRYAYSWANAYTITLVVTDQKGNRNTSTASIKVK